MIRGISLKKIDMSLPPIFARAYKCFENGLVHFGAYRPRRFSVTPLDPPTPKYARTPPDAPSENERRSEHGAPPPPIQYLSSDEARSLGLPRSHEPTALAVYRVCLLPSGTSATPSTSASLVERDRLEFLGDALLYLVTTRALFDAHRGDPRNPARYDTDCRVELSASQMHSRRLPVIGNKHLAAAGRAAGVADILRRSSGATLGAEYDVDAGCSDDDDDRDNRAENRVDRGPDSEYTRENLGEISSADGSRGFREGFADDMIRPASSSSCGPSFSLGPRRNSSVDMRGSGSRIVIHGSTSSSSCSSPKSLRRTVGYAGAVRDDNIVADAMEALVGAVFTVAGMEAAEAWVRRHIMPADFDSVTPDEKRRQSKMKRTRNARR